MAERRPLIVVAPKNRASPGIPARTRAGIRIALPLIMPFLRSRPTPRRDADREDHGSTANVLQPLPFQNLNLPPVPSYTSSPDCKISVPASSVPTPARFGNSKPTPLLLARPA